MGDRNRQRQLLGYLLGALDDRERKRIDEQLLTNPDLEAELARVEESLSPLRKLARVHRPRPGLAARTCSMVFAYSEALASRKGEPRATRRAKRERARTMSPAAVPPTSTATWGWSDLLVAAGVFLAIAGLIFPAIQSSRMNMRLVACQNNLRQVGVAQAQSRQMRPAASDGVAASTADLSPPVSFASFVDAREAVDSTSQPAAESSRTDARVLPIVTVGLGRNVVSPHQGVSQKAHGQNLLFLDGRAAFVAMAPIDLSDESTEFDDSVVSHWPVDGVNPVAIHNASAPIVLVGNPGR